MTFVLQVTDQRLGLDLPPAKTLHALDVSLFTPDGELFARQKLNGTRASFAVSADVAPEGVRDLRRSTIGYVFQTFNLVNALTVEKNIRKRPRELLKRSASKRF